MSPAPFIAAFVLFFAFSIVLLVLDKTVPKECTKPMKIGLMVDDSFSGNEFSFTVKCLKRDDPAEYDRQQNMDENELCTEVEFDEATKRAEAIMREPFYKWLRDSGCVFQYPLQGYIKHEKELLPVCGLADAITETPDVVYIDDGKSTNAQKVKTISKWYFACKEMGYLRQLAVYVQLWKQNHPGDKRRIITRHFTVYEAKKGVFKVKLFVIPQSMLKPYWNEFSRAVKAIADETEWVDEPVTWESAKTLRDPKEKVFEETIGDAKDF